MAHWKERTRLAANRWKYSRIYQADFGGRGPSARELRTAIPEVNALVRVNTKLMESDGRVFLQAPRIAFELPVQSDLLFALPGLRKLSCVSLMSCCTFIWASLFVEMPDEKLLLHTNNCTLKFYETQQVRMSNVISLVKVFTIFSPRSSAFSWSRQKSLSSYSRERFVKVCCKRNCQTAPRFCSKRPVPRAFLYNWASSCQAILNHNRCLTEETISRPGGARLKGVKSFFLKVYSMTSGSLSSSMYLDAEDKW